MLDYGILPADEGDGLLPWSWAQERLAACRNYFLATGRPDGAPHVMVIWGVWHTDDDRFYFSTGKSSVKGRNLAQQPRCVLTTSDGEEAVIVEGRAALLEGAERAAIAPVYQRKYGVDISTMSEPLYVVTPRLVFGQIEETFTKSATRWQFDS
jgi:nitroimidazol reductase NimA-like FMN-containing flavoprotein (pyridoxamine 5'-phosphate oxidase superfamily)